MVKKSRSKNRVNVKARLNRHLRIVKENIEVDNKEKKVNKTKIIQHSNYSIVLFFILLIMPIYPTLASFLYNTSRYDFYRWDIDESSIIESYYWWENNKANINNPMLESTDSFISVNTILDDERDVTWSNEIIEYEVKSGDSFSVIAYKFKVSTNSIYWANNFTKKHTLKPWDIIKVPPVTWLIYKVEKWDTLSSIAKKYKIEEDIINKQNRLDDWWKLIVWEVIIIPWAIKKAPPKPVYKKPAYTKPTYIAKPKPSNSTWYKFVKSGRTEYVSKTGKYELIWRKPYSWAWWNCTYYVASYAGVNWRWNANRWMANAKAKWHTTWKVPKIGSIVQLEWRGYNPIYGHVALVMDITPTHIIVSEMNYRKLNEITYRKVLKTDRAIVWYIYIKK